MKLPIYILLATCIFLNKVEVQAQGLFFKGNEYIIDERTSYSVFEYKKPTFKDYLLIDFDFSAEHLRDIGYICRIKTQDPALTFNLSYDSQGHEVVYKLNEESKSTLITIRIPKSESRLKNWQAIQLKLDLSKQFVSFTIGDKQDSCTIVIPKQLQPDIYFGKSDYFIDLPTFSIRDLRVSDNSQAFTFLFREHEGNIVHDQNGSKVGTVENPTWLINKAYYWKQIASFQSIYTAGFNFDSITNSIYYYNQDSITSYDIITKKSQTRAYDNEFPIQLRLGYNFLDAQDRSLYTYELIPVADNVTTMAKYDLQNNIWHSISNKRFPLWLHHHGKFFDKANNRFIIFGGFGDMYYNNDFNCYDLATDRWSKLKFSGDTIFPRYFLSMGYNESNNSIYVFGGMGNESGEYNVGRKYYYDLYQVDLTKMHITKLWEIPWTNDHVVPVKSMIVDDKHFMTMCYPEHFSNTHLQLYRFSIENGSYEILGDSIPVRSEKITTNADLFYSREMSELYCIVQEFENDDIASSLNIYSLAMPAISYNELFLKGKDGTKNRKSMLWILAVPIVFAAFFIINKELKKKKKKEKSSKPTIPSETMALNDVQEEKLIENSIYTFGDFTVLDKKGKNISYMFSTRLKQTFLLILEHSMDKGISTQQLTNILWSDRDDERAKNVRGVTINSLRKIFEEMDGINLVYEKSHYKIVFEGRIFCDYTKCIELALLEKTDINLSEFSSIILRGRFLKDDEDPIYDSLKASLERQVEPILKAAIEDNYKQNNLDVVILLCYAMFNIDPISDFAIIYLANAMEKSDMASESRKRFFRFIVEYKKMIGEEYPKDYSDIIRDESIN